MTLHPSQLSLCAIVAALAAAPASAQGPLSEPALDPRPAWVALGVERAPDFYVVLRGADDVYLRNQGDGRFADGTNDAGLAGLRSLAAAAADFDRDGHLDLLRVGADHTLRLHRGGAAGVFVDVTDLAGLTGAPAAAARWADLDGDGLPDLVVEVPGAAPRLHRNRDGLTFEALELPLPVWQGSGAARAPLAVTSAPAPDEDAGGERGGERPDAEPVGARRGSARTVASPSTGRADATVASGPGGPGAPGPSIHCLPGILDQATGGCVQASSVPALGSLFPLSSQLNVDPSTGYVGIGMTNASTRLHVLGDVRSEGEVYASFGSSSEPTLRFGSGNEDAGLSSPNFEEVAVITNGLERVRVDSSGRVGIGTGNPSHNVQVSDTGDVRLVLDADTDNSGSFDHPLLRLQQNAGAINVNLTFREGSHDFLIDSPDGYEQHFKINDTSGVNDWEFQNYTDVEARISDLGNLSLDGTVSSPATDLAEYYPLGEAVEPGHVVAFRGEGLELFRAGPADRALLAGIVSSKPGLLLGITSTEEDSDAVPAPPIPDAERYLGSVSELLVDRLVLHEIEQNDRAPLALAGRVPCKVTDENGPIRAGDLLTVSSTPGHAMKATAPGPIVGTSLQSFDAGQGTIVVLANLGWYAPGGAEVETLAEEVRSLRAALRALEERVEGD